MISVCMATYNGMPFLAEQISSILPQLGPHDELIIVDDKSTDQTLNYLKSLSDKRILVSQNTKNLGPAKSFKAAMIQSSGDYIFLSDQDDVWTPNKVSVCMEELKSAILVTHAVKFVNQKLEEIKVEMESKDISTSTLRILIKNRYIGATLAFRKELKERCVNQIDKAPMHDWWIALIASRLGKIKIIHEKLLLYRRHESTLTKPKRSLQIRPISILYRLKIAYLFALWEMKKFFKFER